MVAACTSGFKLATEPQSRQNPPLPRGSCSPSKGLRIAALHFANHYAGRTRKGIASRQRSSAIAFCRRRANNSDLTQILQKLSDLSGMAISGLDKGPRIFGVYGPGNSRDVLADLLVGSGYNFLIVGGAIDGTPRELVLTSQSADIVDLFSVKPVPTPFADRDDPRLPTPERDSTTSVATGPGAISPAPSQDDKDDVTHRQQTLQRLQQIQEQQKAPE
jgi:hypothetical protein